MTVILVAMSLTLAGSFHGAGQSPDVIYRCEGESASNGYPYGRQQHDPVRFTIILRDQRVLFRGADGEESDPCLQGAVCERQVTDESAAFEIRSVPRRDPLYVQSFRLDRTASTFTHRGGGLDGGWSQTGSCESEPSLG